MSIRKTLDLDKCKKHFRLYSEVMVLVNKCSNSLKKRNKAKDIRDEKVKALEKAKKERTDAGEEYIKAMSEHSDDCKVLKDYISKYVPKRAQAQLFVK